MTSYPKTYSNPTLQRRSPCPALGPVPTLDGLAKTLRPFIFLAPPDADESDFRRAERAARAYCLGGRCAAPDLLFLAQRALVRLFGLDTFTTDPPEVWMFMDLVKSRNSLTGRGAA